MQVTQVKINGISNPIGFAYEKVKCSWKVTDTKAKKQEYVTIRAYSDVECTDQVYIKEGKKLNSIGEILEIDLKPCTRYYYTVEVQGDNGESATSEVAWFETGKMNLPWIANAITLSGEDAFHPVFVKTFAAQDDIKSARIYITGAGLYEAYLNGDKIGEDMYAPFTSDYDNKMQYQTYDVTNMLKNENELRILCGKGWYMGRLGYEGHEAVFGNQFWTLAELHVTYADGTQDIIKTDKSWKYCGSDIESSDIYDGEVYNRTLWDGKENPMKEVELYDLNMKTLVERDSLPLKGQEELKVAKVIQTPAKEMVLDFEQNFTGYIEFKNTLPAGTKVVFDFGEILQNDNFYNDNYRTAKSQFVYVSNGEEEIVRPHFTFFGFRYVRVTGWVGELTEDAVWAKAVYSQLDVTTEFESNNSKINRLYLNCLWGQKSNFIDMPLDCPQRDERLGWTGDAQVFAPTASFNMDTRAFYAKFLDDLRLEQLKWNGSVPNFIPNYTKNHGGAAVWGDAAVFIPMVMYEYFGDKDRLEHDYPMMKDWIDYISRECEAHNSGKLVNYAMQFGDWLGLDGITEQSFKGGTDDSFVATVYYHASAQKLSRAAEILGLQNESRKYEELAQQIRQAILDEFFSSNGRLAIDTQAAYIIALRFNVYRKKERIISGLKERLRKDCYRIKCGFVGAPVMCQVLAENGMEEMAYRIFFYEGFPGWLRCVNLGATTIWERWNSVLDDGRISGTNMNSLNHYSYGSVMEFVYRYTVGLVPIEPAFKNVMISPKIINKLSEISYKYDSISGKYVIYYKVLENGEIKMHIEVPFNCKAKLCLPGTDEETMELEAGVTELQYMPKYDFMKPFTENSILDELKQSKEAVAILEKYAPAAIDMIKNDDIESLSLSLADMLHMPYMGFDEDEVRKAIAEIKEVRFV